MAYPFIYLMCRLGLKVLCCCTCTAMKVAQARARVLLLLRSREEVAVRIPNRSLLLPSFLDARALPKLASPLWPAPIGRGAEPQLPDELSTLTALTVLHLDLPWHSPGAGHWPLPLAAPALRFLSLSHRSGLAPFHAVTYESYQAHPLDQLTGAPVAALLCFIAPMGDLEHLSGSHPRHPAQQNPHHLSGPNADGDANGDGGGDGDGDGRPSQQGRGRVAPPHA